jgi:hypothetical protein
MIKVAMASINSLVKSLVQIYAESGMDSMLASPETQSQMQQTISDITTQEILEVQQFTL